MIYYAHAQSISGGAQRAGRARYVEVAAQFSIGLNTLVRWVQQRRETGSVAPKAKGGGWQSPVDLPLLHTLVKERPDSTTDELTGAYNRHASPDARVHRSSILRAWQRSGYVFKKNDRDRRNRIARRSKLSGVRSSAGSDG